jgi:uncharacterized protein with beta-barrel porin domain
MRQRSRTAEKIIPSQYREALKNNLGGTKVRPGEIGEHKVRADFWTTATRSGTRQ